MNISQPTNNTQQENNIFENTLSLDGKKILEIGCGNANKTRLIATNGVNRKITATEVDVIQHKKNILIDDLPNVSFEMASCESMPFDDNSFDIVFMFKSLHHVPVDLMEDALKEIKRVLKSEAIAYISEPVFAGDYNEILRLFHDEEVVRIAAFNTLKKVVNEKKMLLLDEIFFNTPILFKSFEDFEDKVIKVTHSNHQLSKELYQRVKDQFSLHLKQDGAHFLAPIRVDLLQKQT